MTTRTCRPQAALLVAAVAAALANGAALAQDADTSAWKCELCPFAAGHGASGAAGVTSADEDASYLGDATGYDESGAYGNVDAVGSYTGEDYLARWRVDDLLLDSRVLRMDGRRPGAFKYRLEYAQIPHREFITTRSVFVPSGDALLALPDGWVAAPQTTAFTALDASLVRRDIVEFEPEPSERVTAAPARDGKRHRRAGNRAVVVADQPFDHPAVAHGAARAAGGGDHLFIGPAQQQQDQRGAVERAATPQPLRDMVAVGLGVAEHVGGKVEADFVGNLLDQRDEHRRHQRAFLLGQPRAIVEEQVAPNDGQPVAPRAARGFDTMVGSFDCDRPFDGHHSPALDDRS